MANLRNFNLIVFSLLFSGAPEKAATLTVTPTSKQNLPGYCLVASNSAGFSSSSLFVTLDTKKIIIE